MGFFSKLFSTSKSKSADNSSKPAVPPSPFNIIDGVLKKYTGSESTVNIPQGIVKINQLAFMKNTCIQNVVIPTGVKEIGRTSFIGCINLKSVLIPDTVLTIDSDAFSSCTNLKNIELPENIETIGESAFSRSGLESIKLPSGLKKIGSQAFKGCKNLSKVYWNGNVRKIGVSTFSECSNLRMIEIPEGVREIAVAAFSDCKNLVDVFIPDSIEDIDDEAFRNSPNVILHVHKGSKAEKTVKTLNKSNVWKVHIIESKKNGKEERQDMADQRSSVHENKSQVCQTVTKTENENGNQIIRIRSQDTVFPIYHKLENGRWPFLATNGVAKVFSKKEKAEEYCCNIERNIYVNAMSQGDFKEALKSWYFEGITKVCFDEDDNTEILISDLLDDCEFPDKIYYGSEINRLIIVCMQLSEDDQGFLANIMYNSLQSNLPKNVFLTPVNSKQTNLSEISCTDLSDKCMTNIGELSFLGTKSYTISRDAKLNSEDIKLFDVEGKKIIYAFTNMTALKKSVGDNVQVGVVAYGDIIYRLTNEKFLNDADGMIINPDGVGFRILK
ncbi:MAG: leucine-rich repeat domain-containing protein [Oscillospiraceae bacterium]|nr:leucine-rich repeat domain-containing protein [Oscillospiraceae bacterium]